MEVYEEYAHCFSCGHREPLDGLGIPKPTPKQSVNIAEVYAYINSLPKMPIRGLSLPCDPEGYFICWPDNSFYKKRLFDGKVRYLSPTGHKPPLLKFPGSDYLTIVEGEINAISLASSITGPTICSPGSATELTKHLDYYLIFDKILIIVDKDIPGVSNGIKLKDKLIKHGKNVSLYATKKDCNQILQEEGKEGLKKWYEEKSLGMF